MAEKVPDGLHRQLTARVQLHLWADEDDSILTVFVCDCCLLCWHTARGCYARVDLGALNAGQLDENERGSSSFDLSLR